MTCFNFRTFFDGRSWGEGFFEYPDSLGNKSGFTICQLELTAFIYSDPIVGSFNLSNLHTLRLTVGAIPTDCFFTIVMSKPNGLDAIVSSFVQPGILGVVAGKSLKIEWPTPCHAMPVQEFVFPSVHSGEVSSTTKVKELKENTMTDVNIATVNSDSHPPIPVGSKGTFTPSPDTGAHSPTCNVIKFNGLTYWAYSYDDNRIGMNIVAYDASNKVVKQWEKTGARYLWKITADVTNQTVTFHGQASQTISMKWSELSEAAIAMPSSLANTQADKTLTDGHKAVNPAPVQWSNWEDLGGVITSGPAVASWSENRLDCFAKGQDNHMWHKWWDGAKWSGWEDLGGVIDGTPAAVSWASNRIDCFGRGMDNHLWHKWWNGSKWSNWEDLGGVITSGPTVASWSENRLDCFAKGQNNHLWHKWWDGSKWSGWEDLGGMIDGAPAAVSWGPNRIDCFGRGMDNHLWHKWWNGSKWSNWENLGGIITSGPAVASWAENRLDCFAKGQNNHLWQKSWDGSKWSDWEDLGGVIDDAPGAVSWSVGRVDCFGRGMNNHMWHKFLPNSVKETQVKVNLTIETVNASTHPAIPAGSKASFMPSADSLEQSTTCQVIKFNGLTYWAYSYDDNRIGMNIVAYDAANKVVKQWEKTGARYLWKVTADVTNQTVTFHGQASQTISMKWSELAVV